MSVVTVCIHRMVEGGSKRTDQIRFVLFSPATAVRGILYQANEVSTTSFLALAYWASHLLRGDHGMQPTPNILSVGNISLS